MKTSARLTGKADVSLAGPDAFDLYLKAIAWNLRTMMGQADVLETVILETKRKLREHIAMESRSGGPPIAPKA